MLTELLAQVAAPDILNVTQCGVAGLMGALWWWERKYSRQREDQLTEAHQLILAQRHHLQAMLDALQGNTRVIAEFTSVQSEILHLLRPHGAPPENSGSAPMEPRMEIRGLARQ